MSCVWLLGQTEGVCRAQTEAGAWLFFSRGSQGISPRGFSVVGFEVKVSEAEKGSCG